jgi:hypothetical protein
MVKAERIAQLEAALEEAQRAPHRQAAPFRGDPQKRALAPKRPGRQRGHPGACRPEPEQIDEFLEVQLCSCPHCGGTQFKDQNAIEQLIEDIPPVRPPRHTADHLPRHLCGMRSECPFPNILCPPRRITGHRCGRCAPWPTSLCFGGRSQQGQRPYLAFLKKHGTHFDENYLWD